MFEYYGRHRETQIVLSPPDIFSKSLYCQKDRRLCAVSSYFDIFQSCSKCVRSNFQPHSPDERCRSHENAHQKSLRLDRLRWLPKSNILLRQCHTTLPTSSGESRYSVTCSFFGHQP